MAEQAPPGRVVLVRAPTASAHAGRAAAVVSALALHAGAALAIARGATPALVLLATASYGARMLAVTCVYHRYFTHRALRMGRYTQLALAVLGTTAGLGGPLSFAARDRAHHRHADAQGDPHAPGRVGLARAHASAWLDAHAPARLDRVPDLAGYPELRWLDGHHAVGPLALVALLLATGGLDAALWGFALPTCVLLHAVGAVRSLGHATGARRFVTADRSRNAWLFGLLTFGEGFHNNHHRRRSSAKLGVVAWELDLGWLALRALARVGLVSGLRCPGARAPRARTSTSPADEPPQSAA